MKSLMEEASSIAKAIEQGWARAGKPKEFTVRIYEEPEKNFIGLTKKPAKVAIFFKEVTPEPNRMKEIKRLVERRDAERAAKAAAPIRRFEKERRAPVQPQYQQVQQQQPQQPKMDRWTPELIQKAKNWMEMALKQINKASTQFTMQPRNYSLTVTFAGPLFDDIRREQLFFKASSHLLMQALKTQAKKGLKGYKVILLSQK